MSISRVSQHLEFERPRPGLLHGSPQNAAKTAQTRLETTKRSVELIRALTGMDLMYGDEEDE